MRIERTDIGLLNVKIVSQALNLIRQSWMPNLKPKKIGS